jgi:hypothetical protein
VTLELKNCFGATVLNVASKRGCALVWLKWITITRASDLVSMSGPSRWFDG